MKALTAHCEYTLAMQEAGGEGFGLDRIVLPMSSLASWALIAVGGLTGMHVLGLNIQPLLAVGGISGLAIGLGAQTVTANAIAGINLVRPPHLAETLDSPCSCKACEAVWGRYGSLRLTSSARREHNTINWFLCLKCSKEDRSSIKKYKSTAYHVQQ